MAGRDDRQAAEELLAYRSEALIVDRAAITSAQLARVANQMLSSTSDGVIPETALMSSG